VPSDGAIHDDRPKSLCVLPLAGNTPIQCWDAGLKDLQVVTSCSAITVLSDQARTYWIPAVLTAPPNRRRHGGSPKTGKACLVTSEAVKCRRPNIARAVLCTRR